jgi:hypothetical protein
MRGRWATRQHDDQNGIWVTTADEGVTAPVTVTTVTLCVTVTASTVTMADSRRLCGTDTSVTTEGA